MSERYTADQLYQFAAREDLPGTAKRMLAQAGNDAERLEKVEKLVTGALGDDILRNELDLALSRNNSLHHALNDLQNDFMRLQDECDKYRDTVAAQRDEIERLRFQVNEWQVTSIGWEDRYSEVQRGLETATKRINQMRIAAREILND